MDLIIVESPTKAKTITKFIEPRYKIESSFGHIRDLPKKEMGVDIENNFEPKYIIPAQARQAVKKLKELSKKASKIILATDEDREGEAIAWHLCQALNLNDNKISRIAFHEITEAAVKSALARPGQINMRLVDAQQARRVLDRLVGYELSPFLWKKVAKGLSAGRVQSVAVRLIVEREREIKNFRTQEYWTITALLRTADDKTGQQTTEFSARLNKISGQTIDKLKIKNKQQADEILSGLESAKYIVAGIERKQTKKNPLPPFTTSTLQQAANRLLGYSARQTMVVAQQLYESGFITYMRTDSLNLSENFLKQARQYLTSELGGKYSLAKPRRFKATAKGAQEAHEAIRPTDLNRAPEALKSNLNNNQAKLYRLIWQRALASQMPQAVIDATTIDINASNTEYQFRATGQVIEFDGYLKIYPEKSQELILPAVEKNQPLDLIKLKPEQHYTKPPARYSDAGLVKALEKYGIGRPSTYAPTIATIEARNYVERDDHKKLKPTDIAFIVNDLLIEHFPKIVDYQFTAKIENDLDEIARGATDWQPMIRDFYQPFHANLENKYQELKKADIVPEKKSDQLCDKCGSPMIIKIGRYGKFLACSAFPECKNIKPLNENGGSKNSQEKDQKIKQLEEKYKDQRCDKCGSPMAVKNGRFGPFLACSAFPKCRNIKNINGGNQTTGVKCPNCAKGEIVAKRSRRGIFYGCNQYPDCKTAFWAKPTGEKCPDCGDLLVAGKQAGVKCSNKGCGYQQ